MDGLTLLMSPPAGLSLVRDGLGLLGNETVHHPSQNLLIGLDRGPQLDQCT